MKKCVLVLLLIGVSVSAQKETRIAVFSKTVGYRHESIGKGIIAIQKLGKENNFLVDTTEDADMLTSNLKKYSAVVFLNTTGNIFNKKQQKAFENYIKNKGGFVGVHAATDTEFTWPWYGELIGAYFEAHPKQQEASIRIVDNKHSATSFLGETWIKYDEWYNFKNISSEINVLMNLDETSYIGGTNGESHPISWYQEFGGGKMFYTGLGHTKESYVDPTFLKHLLGGIQYVIE